MKYTCEGLEKVDEEREGGGRGGGMRDERRGREEGGMRGEG